MNTFAEHFCLKDGRDNFFIDQNRDWQLVLGSKKYKKSVDEMLEAAIASRRAPRLVWVGDFGLGKTHHINYTYNKINEAPQMPFKVIRMDLPDVQDNSEFNVLFERMVNEVGQNYFMKLLAAHVAANPNWLGTVTPTDVRKTLRQLALNEDVADQAWDFLCGRKLSKDGKVQVGVSKLQLNDSEEYASVFLNIAHVIREQTEDKRVLLYLIDEVEGLAAVRKANYLNKWVLALRKMLDVIEVGVILAVGSLSLQDIPELLLNGALVRRIGNENYVMLEQYDITEAKIFMEDLLTQFIDPAKKALVEANLGLASDSDYDSKLFPFKKDAFEAFCEHLVGDTARAKPAQFLLKLHSTLSAAMKDGKQVIDRAYLEARGEWK